MKNKNSTPSPIHYERIFGNVNSPNPPKYQ